METTKLKPVAKRAHTRLAFDRFQPSRELSSKLYKREQSEE